MGPFSSFTPRHTYRLFGSFHLDAGLECCRDICRLVIMAVISALSVLDIHVSSFWTIMWILNYCETFVLPEFQSIIEPTIYYADNHVGEMLEICCDTWPKRPIGRVSYYSTYHFPQSTPVNMSDQVYTEITNMHQKGIYHVPSNFMCDHHTRYGNKSYPLHCLCFSNVSVAEQFSGEKTYCRANTDFGSLLSRPFQISVKRSVAQKTSVQVNIIYRLGNIATIPCNFNKLYSFERIFFTFNNTEITNLFSDKRRLVRTPQNGYQLLLIRGFQPQDQGLYKCGFFNPRFHTKRYSTIIYHLLVEDSPTSSLKAVLLMNLYGTVTDSNGTKPISIAAHEGQSISLFCSFDSPRSSAAKVDDFVNELNGNQKFEPLFGVLDTRNLTNEDEGLYSCSTDKITLYAYLRILPSSKLLVYPGKIKANLEDFVNLSCVSLGIDSTLTWYFNGIRRQSTTSPTNPHHTLLIDSMNSSYIGVYQCIIENGTDMWMDSIVMIVLPEQSLFTKDGFDSALSKYSVPTQLGTELMVTKIGDTRQLKCLSSEDLDLYNSKVAQYLDLLLPAADSQGHLQSRLNISCLLNILRVEWWKDGEPLQLLAFSVADHELNCSSLFTIDIATSRPNAYGVYSCNLYFGEQLILRRYFKLIESNASAYSLINQRYADLPSSEYMYSHGELLENSFGTDDEVVSTDHVETVLLRKRRSQVHRFNEWPSNFEKIVSSPVLNVSSSRNAYERLKKPNATTVGDNLAVLIIWNSVNCDFYRIIHRSRIPESDGWIHRSTIDETVEECCSQDITCCFKNKHFYLTSRHPGELVPGKSYQFRIHAIKQATDQIIDKSPWSDPVSFQHISKVAPVITETERLSDGGILARWTLAISAVGFPIDHFLLLYRPEERSNNGKITYNGFKAVFVNGSASREHKLQALEPGKGYQIVVYGVHTPRGLDPQSTIFTGGLNGRKITQFSHEVFVKPRSISMAANDNRVSQDSALRSVAKSREHYNTKNVVAFNSMESNRLMFLVLGALTGVMLLIMICLVVLCIWRQRRDKHRLVINRSASGCDVIPCNPRSFGTTDKSLKKENFGTTGGFLLDNLHSTPLMISSNTISGHRLANKNFENVERPSIQYPSRPPPMSPAPPPPPKYLTTNENFELRSLTSNSDGMRNIHTDNKRHVDIPSKSALLTSSTYYPAHQKISCVDYPISPSCHTIMNHSNSGIIMDGSFSNPRLLLSSYADEHVGASEIVDSLTHEDSCYLLQSAIINGLKREPPSGGSMHGGTDDEFGLPDKDAMSSMFQHANEHLCSTELYSYSHKNPNSRHSFYDDVSNNDNIDNSNKNGEQNAQLDFYPSHFNRTISSYHPLHHHRFRHHHSQRLYCHGNGNNESGSPPVMVNLHNFIMNENRQLSKNVMFTSCIPNYDPGLLTPPNIDDDVNNNNNNNADNNMVMHSSQYPYVYRIDEETRHHDERHHPRSTSCQFSHILHQPQSSSSSFIHPDLTSNSINSDKGLKFFGLSQLANHRDTDRSIHHFVNPQENFSVSISDS
ncbi:unnamed protein product [Heterobilharzia americana]|nr:unnamed protein product [Heterobilharzia americana]